MIKKSVVVKSKSGLHARPATELVKLANGFKSSVTILYEEKSINAKDMFAILSCGIECGFNIHVVCDGEDEVEALNNICALIEKEDND